MSQAERDRLVALKKAKRKLITQKEAAEEIGITERQVRRLLRKLKRLGDKAVIHGLRGQPSNRRLASATEQEAMGILSDPVYRGFGPTLAAEYLRKKHKLAVSKETLRNWMGKAGLWKSHSRRIAEVHVWRPRRSCFGDLVQWDTSEHDWLEGRGEEIYLIAMIDDATSQLLARFVRHDSTVENMGLLRQYLLLFGRPLAFYTDKASLFQTAEKTKRGEQRGGKDQAEMPPTQIGRALRELNIVWIPAHSPQAKGRVERGFGTAQDRLVKGLRVAGARTLEEANAYLDAEFLPWWNQTLAVVPANPTDAHRPLGKEHDLAAILSHVEERQVANDYTVRYDGKIYQIDRKDVRSGMRGAKVRVELRLDGSMAICFRNRYVGAKQCAPAPKVAAAKPAKPRRSVPRRRGSDWNKNFDLHTAPKIWQVAGSSGARKAESLV
jgi:DNA-binding Lrp family transcriptional regulator